MFLDKHRFLPVLTSVLLTYLKNLDQNEGHPPGNADLHYGERKPPQCAPSIPLMAQAVFLLPCISLCLSGQWFTNPRMKCLLWETSYPSGKRRGMHSTSRSHEHIDRGISSLRDFVQGTETWMWAVTRCPEGNKLSTPSASLRPHIKAHVSL